MSQTVAFRQIFNRVIGRSQWQQIREDFDYHQEVARSAYADMLHDHDRNRKYRQAIEHSVRHLKLEQPNRPVVVLDIGTGTGLLAMMALRAGADQVYACEAFAPVADCAERILKLNDCSAIKLIKKNSNQIVIGKDMPVRANMLVAELFDTELIGEAALLTYKHAMEHLLTSDAVLVPCSANIYAHVLESEFLWRHNRLLQTQGQLENFPFKLQDQCHGCGSLFDLQSSQLKLQSSVDVEEPNIRLVTKDPILLETIRFDTRDIALKHSQAHTFESSLEGKACAVLVWWDLQMEPTDTTPRITMEPEWLRSPSPSSWREHWMQAVYFSRQLVPVKPHHQYSLLYHHEDLSMWFDLDNEPISQLPALNMPFCDCGVHLAFSRQRLAQMNSSWYRDHCQDLLQKIQQNIENLDDGKMVNLFVHADSSLLPYMLRDRTLGNVYIIDQNPLSAQLLSQHVLTGQSSMKLIDGDLDRFLVDNASLLAQSHNLLVAEPFTSGGVLPWDHISFWYVLSKLKTISSSCVLVAPSELKIYTALVKLRNLHKIRHPLGNDCEGFDLTPFDEMIHDSCRKSDARIEQHPLWEYPAVACSQAKLAFELPFVADDSILPVFSPSSNAEPVWPQVDTRRLTKTCTFTEDEADFLKANAMVFWCDWGQTRPKSQAFTVGREISWHATGQQQGVLMFYPDELQNLHSKRSLTLTTHIEIASGEIRMSIDNL